MKIITKRAMTINEAVDFATADIQVGARSMVLQTVFGDIPVEVFDGTPGFDYSETYSWKSCYPSEWVVSNRNRNFDWYIKINYKRGMDPILLRVQLIRELSTVMYRTLDMSHSSPNSSLVSMFAYEYLRAFHANDSYISYSEFSDAYIKLRSKGMKRIGSSNTIRKEISKAFKNEAVSRDMVYDACMKMFREEGFSVGSFGNRFYDVMAASVILKGTGCRDRYQDIMAKEGDIDPYNLIKTVITKEK